MEVDRSNYFMKRNDVVNVMARVRIHVHVHTVHAKGVRCYEYNQGVYYIYMYATLVVSKYSQKTSLSSIVVLLGNHLITNILNYCKHLFAQHT